MSRFELRDTIAIVTGSTGGIGRSIAVEYAKAGANVVVTDRDQDKLDKVAAEIRALGRESFAIAADVTVPEQVDDMVKQAVDRFGRIDIMVNNFDSNSYDKPEDVTPDTWNSLLTLNLSAAFYCSIAAGKVMIEQKRGKLINISSVAGIKGESMMVPYAVAKAGIINMTKSLALAWGPHNINVNCIAPGRITVPGESIEGMPDEEYKKQSKPETLKTDTPVSPLQLPGKPEDIADMSVFLASAASDMITGEVYIVRGTEWASVYV